jgi:cell division protein FtsI (penicillin-binding protein 3)
MSRSVQYTSSPLLASKTPVWRSQFVVAMIALGFLGLVVRAAYVQLFDNDFFQRQGAVRFERTIDLPANRGRILDRNGQILASSVPVPSIWASPEDLEADAEKLAQLAKILKMSQADLQQRVAEKQKTFVWLKRLAGEEVAAQVKALGIKGVYDRKEYKRLYPEGEAAAHVVGFTNVENLGQEGIELAFNEKLAGKPGTRRVIKNRLGQIVEDMGQTVLPIDGQDIQLSVDSKVQFFAYQRLRQAVLEHRAAAGSVVVIDVEKNEVLALANYPSYTPENRTSLTGAQLRNRALTDTFEPGSTMKPFVISLALERGLVTPESVIQTAPGKLAMAGHVISDSHPHGALTVREVIQKSSNIGTVKIALQMPAQSMWEMFTQIGLGQKPQVPFPGAVSGKLRAANTWHPIEQATMSYGYGLSASLFQLTQAYTMFARDGVMMPASLIKHKDTDLATGHRVIDARHASVVREMLHTVTLPGGTAIKAQTMGYSVGGKTGTAHKSEGKGYVHKYRGFFVGLAPIDHPRIAVGVMIDEPSNGVYYGGDVAAPVFSQTVQQTLRMMGVAPNMMVKPQVVAKTEPESF